MNSDFSVRTSSNGDANPLQSAQAQTKFNEGLALHHKGRLAQAQVAYQQVLTLQPRHFEALHLLGVIAAQSKDYAKAIDYINRSLEINPQNATAYCNRGNALCDSGEYHEAIQSYDKAIALKRDYAVAHNGLGTALRNLKQYFAAIDSFEKALAIKPDYVDAYNNLGSALVELSQYRLALKCYNRALAAKPGDTQTLSNRSSALIKSKQHQASINSHGSGHSARPDATVYFNCGNTLVNQRQYQSALEYFEEAFAIEPGFAEAYYMRGNILIQLGQYQAAIDSFDKAISIKPDFADAHYNCGTALAQLQQFQGAVQSYDRAFNINPGTEYLYGMRHHAKMKICDWSQANIQLVELMRGIQHDERISAPFHFLAVSASLPRQRQAAEIWIKDRHPINLELGPFPKRIREKRIRLGYYSADFHNHATAYLMAQLFEQHDKSRFELLAFSFGPDFNDEMRQRLTAAFDQFVDVRNQSDKEVALLSRSMGIDIAIDLKGFTQDERVGIFAYRAAPVQVNYLGYPGTIGADYIDYLIADETLIPEECRQYYAEKIAYLPNSYQVNDRQRQIADKVFTRQELGLPEQGFVFCCFNNNYKITPATFDGWMRVLKQVEGSVLWLLEDNPSAASNLRKEAQQRGVDPQRLVFAKRMPLPEHLARHRAADLFIDTLPCNAHTTASDALWAGLPVLTCTGEAFASRVAASLLSAIDLPELITTMQQDYEALAIELATNPDRLKAIRQKLQDNRLTTPLFDTELFTKHIEDAYTQMFERYQADLPPEHIFVGNS